MDRPERNDDIQRLNETNYTTWSKEMAAKLRKKGLWRLVAGERSKPDPLEAGYDSWLEDSEKAAGDIYLCLDPQQRVHIEGLEDDPISMWSTLASVHLHKQAGTRFNAYSDLFNIVKKEDESLQSLMNRTGLAMTSIKNLRPKEYTLSSLDDELEIMTLVRALPNEYSNFSSALLLKDNLTKSAVQEAFKNEEANRLHRAKAEAAFKAQVIKASPPSNPFPSKAEKFCPIHKSRGHSLEECHWVLERVKKGEKAKKASAENPQGATAEHAGAASCFLSSASEKKVGSLWCPDTGATSHMTFHREWFIDYTPKVIPIQLADNTTIYSAGTGSIQLLPIIDGSPSNPVILTNVLHVPAIKSNLLSVVFLTVARDYVVRLEKKTMTFSQRGVVLFTATVKPDLGLAFLDGTTALGSKIRERAQIASSAVLSPELLHRRLCHLSYSKIDQLIKGGLVTGVTVHGNMPTDAVCEPCLAGKQHRQPFPKQSSTRMTEPLSLVHSDLHGPLPVQTFSHCRYWISFIDDYSRFAHVFLLKNKSEALAAFKRYKALVENQLGCSIKALRDDKGGEYVSHEFDQLTWEAGISRQRTAPGTPQQNGVAERFNRTSEERITAMLADAGLPLQFWGEAMNAYMEVHNVCPTSAVPDTTPHQRFLKVLPDISHLRRFGSPAFVHVPKKERKHLQSHTRKCIMLGYQPGTKAWRFWDQAQRKVIVSRDAVFIEQQAQGGKQDSVPTPPKPPSSSPPTYVSSDDDSSNAPPPPRALNPPPSPPLSPQAQAQPDAPPQIQAQPGAQEPAPLRRSTRIRKPAQDWWKLPQPVTPAPMPVEEEQNSGGDAQSSGSLDDADLENAQDELALKTFAPNSYWHAMTSPESDRWHEAAVEEYLGCTVCWDIVPLPAGKKAIPSKWVFTLKERLDGSVERYKARIVAKGFQQIPGLDYDETFAPVAKLVSIRAILSIAALEDWEIDQVDFTQAFLNGDLEEDIYMKQPEGFHEGGPEMVCHLKRALYGLKQAPRQWYKKMDQLLLSLGFVRSEVDHCLFYLTRDGVKHVIPVYVDDQLLACNDRPTLDWVKSELAKAFPMKDLGPIKDYLGLEAVRDRPNRRLYLSQTKLLKRVLERFFMSGSKPVSTPLDSGVPLSTSMSPQTEEEQLMMKKVPYLSAVGSLMYLAVGTRPDIAQAVGALGQFNSNPGLGHWHGVQRVLRYLCGTQDHKLCLGRSPEDSPLTLPSSVCLTGYSDSDYAGAHDGLARRSTSGYVFYLGGGAVSWSSKRQTSVALSTTEAEYIASVHAGQEGVWLRSLLAELGYPQSGPTVLNMDSQSAIAVGKNPEHHSRMKHLEIRWHWIRRMIQDKVFAPKYITTNVMVADLLTKSLPRIKHNWCCKALGVIPRAASTN